MKLKRKRQVSHSDDKDSDVEFISSKKSKSTQIKKEKTR